MSKRTMERRLATGRDVPAAASPLRTYEKPRVLFREAIEAAAPSCTTKVPGDQSCGFNPQS